MSRLVSPLTRSEAAEVLGVRADAGPDDVRRAFRDQLRRVHPDLNPAPGAAAATRRLTVAYRVLLEPVPPPARSPRLSDPDSSSDPSDGDAARLVDPHTIVLRSPRGPALAALIAAGDRLGEIGYLDPAAGLLEVVVELVDAPTSSLVVALGERGPTETALVCSVEPLSGGDEPRTDAVVRLLLRTLQGEDPTA